MYTLALLVVAAAFLFLWSHNPVHGVLTLVVVGLGLALCLLNAGLEFTAFVVVLVYVGAVTVLFVFVVMMVNLRATSASFVLVESPVVWIVLAGGLALTGWSVPTGQPAATLHLSDRSNLAVLGSHLYGTERVLLVALVGLVLFVSMVAAICLSLVSSENYRTQDYYTQIRRPAGVFGFSRSFLGVASVDLVDPICVWIVLVGALIVFVGRNVGTQVEPTKPGATGTGLPVPPDFSGWWIAVGGLFRSLVNQGWFFWLVLAFFGVSWLILPGTSPLDTAFEAGTNGWKKVMEEISLSIAAVWSRPTVRPFLSVVTLGSLTQTPDETQTVTTSVSTQTEPAPDVTVHEVVWDQPVLQPGSDPYWWVETVFTISSPVLWTAASTLAWGWWWYKLRPAPPVVPVGLTGGAWALSSSAQKDGVTHYFWKGAFLVWGGIFLGAGVYLGYKLCTGGMTHAVSQVSVALDGATESFRRLPRLITTAQTAFDRPFRWLAGTATPTGQESINKLNFFGLFFLRRVGRQTARIFLASIAAFALNFWIESFANARFVRMSRAGDNLVQSTEVFRDLLAYEKKFLYKDYPAAHQSQYITDFFREGDRATESLCRASLDAKKTVDFMRDAFAARPDADPSGARALSFWEYFDSVWIALSSLPVGVWILFATFVALAFVLGAGWDRLVTALSSRQKASKRD